LGTKFKSPKVKKAPSEREAMGTPFPRPREKKTKFPKGEETNGLY